MLSSLTFAVVVNVVNKLERHCVLNKLLHPDE